MIESSLAASSKIGQHAAVIGGSIAGLLAARVLAAHFQHVTVLEASPEVLGRGGQHETAQSGHVHTLLTGGLDILKRLFPGFEARLASAGAIPVDFAHDFQFFHYRVRKLRFASDMNGFLQTRSLLQSCLFEELQQVRNVHFRFATRLTGIAPGETPPRSGLRLMTQTGETIVAEFVVDASGRHSQLSQWLRPWGVPPVPEEQVALNVGYASRLYKRPASAKVDWKALVVFPKAPEETRGGYVFSVERDRWLVSLVGYVGDHPSHSEDGFLEFARNLPRPDLFEAIQHAEPLSEVVLFRFPRQRWRHFERSVRFPDGIVVLGDAVCCLDPLFGQGMALCAQEAWLLHKWLQAFNQNRPPTGRNFHTRQAQLLRPSWRVTSSEAYRYKAIEGFRPRSTTFLQWYADKVFKLSARDAKVYTTFLRVMHQRKPLSHFFRPSILGRVLLEAARHRSP